MIQGSSYFDLKQTNNSCRCLLCLAPVRSCTTREIDFTQMPICAVVQQNRSLEMFAARVFIRFLYSTDAFCPPAVPPKFVFTPTSCWKKPRIDTSTSQHIERTPELNHCDKRIDECLDRAAIASSGRFDPPKSCRRQHIVTSRSDGTGSVPHTPSAVDLC